MKTYKAPWGRTLIVVSGLATLFCLMITFGLPFLAGAKPDAAWEKWARWLPLTLIFGCALFAIRGYSISSDAILIHRLFWTTRLPRKDLQSADFVPRAMRKSLRTCGNGGFFSFTGFYWSKSLGAYRAYVTDLQRTVVLHYNKRTVIVSPDSPEDFIRELAL